MTTRAGTPPSRGLVLILGALSAFAPLSIDLYLPSLPALVADLGASDAMGQATMSATLLGLAAGQLFLGPLSDRIGRRLPLLVGIGAFVVMSLLCVVAPSIEVLLLARLGQGLAGSAGIVVCRAVVRDLFSGADAARAFATLAAVVAIAPVIAPMLGGGLLLVTDWRGLFVVLAVIGAVLFVLAFVAVSDTLAPENRTAAGIRVQFVEMGRVLRNGRFVLMTLALGLASLGLFSYVSMAPIVLQDQFGLTPQLFSLVFAVNAGGIVVGTQISRRLVGRIPVSTLARVCVGVGAVGATTFAIMALCGMPLLALLVPLFIAILSHGAILANVTAVALAPFTRGAGTASAVLGAFQFAMGAAVPPLASIGGVNVILMGACMASGLLLALVLLLLLRRSEAGGAAR